MRKQSVAQSSVQHRKLLLLVALGAYLGLTVYAFGATGSGSCSTDPESRQLDYWLGTWTMANPGSSSSPSTSTVELSLDKCLIVERWDSGKGHASEKMFAYSPDDKTWYGMFADNEGRAHVFLDGTVTSGTAEFRGPSRGPKGEPIVNKLRVVRMSANRVEETWEKSMDNGSSWTTVYRAEYARAKP